VTGDESRRNLLLSRRNGCIVPKELASVSIAEGVTLVTTTPQPTDHIRLDVDDPRKVEP